MREDPIEQFEAETANPEENLKWCEGCGKQKPIDEFGVDESRADGRRYHCRVCRAKSSAQREMANRELALKQIDDEALAQLQTLANGGGGTYLPYRTDLLEAMMNCFGGVNGLARHIFATYLAAKPGSMVRNKILQSMVDLIHQASEEGDTKKPLEHMTDADLMEMVVGSVLKFQQSAGAGDSMVPLPDGQAVDIRAIAEMMPELRRKMTAIEGKVSKDD